MTESPTDEVLTIWGVKAPPGANLVRIGGSRTFVPDSFQAFGMLPSRQELQVDVEVDAAGTATCHGLRLTAPGPPFITQASLRTIPMAAVLRAALARAARVEDPAGFIRPQLDAADLEAAKTAVETRKRPHSVDRDNPRVMARVKKTVSDHLDEVEQNGVKRRPYKLVGERESVSTATAGRLIKAARLADPEFDARLKSGEKK